MNIDTIAALEKLQRLRHVGTLSEAEFLSAKQRVLDGSSADKDKEQTSGSGIRSNGEGSIQRPMTPRRTSILGIAATVIALGFGAFYFSPNGHWFETYNLRRMGDFDFVFPIIMMTDGKKVELHETGHYQSRSMGPDKCNGLDGCVNVQHFQLEINGDVNLEANWVDSYENAGGWTLKTIENDGTICITTNHGSYPSRAFLGQHGIGELSSCSDGSYIYSNNWNLYKNTSDQFAIFKSKTKTYSKTPFYTYLLLNHTGKPMGAALQQSLKIDGHVVDLSGGNCCIGGS